MLVIAILILLAAIATVVALVAASPLFRSLALAFDSWAESIQSAQDPR